MKKIILMVLFASCIGSGVAASAIAQDDVEPRPSATARHQADLLEAMKGDHVLINPDRNSATAAQILSLHEFQSKYGSSSVQDGASRKGSDAGEQVIPTPDAPSSHPSYKPGDDVVYTLNKDQFFRVTAYRYGGQGVWYMRSNILKGPFEMDAE